MDTLTVAGKPCVDLTFVLQFRVVRLYGTSVRHAGQYVFRASRRDELPQKINLNFVDYMKIEQNLTVLRTVQGSL